MARLFIGSVLAFALSMSAFAGCEDGESIATQAAKKAATQSRFTNCKLTKISDPIDTKAGQNFRVTLRCSRETPTYLVSLREIEDAVCVVKNVRRVTLSTPIKFTCPRGLTLNCTPVTTNPMCHNDWKTWIRNNCPGVRFIE